jgi:hypothetical protein
VNHPPNEGRVETAPPAGTGLGSQALGLLWFAALAIVVVILLHQSLLTANGLVPADAVLNWAPWNQTAPPSNRMLADQYRVFLPNHEFVHQHNKLPLWDPNLCCGKPNLACIQSALLFPINRLLSPLDPFAASGWAAFLKLTLAGWFTLLYLRLLGASHPAAFLAALVFSLSGFMIVWLGHPQVNAAMWLPLLLYLVEESFRHPHGPAALRIWIGFAVVYAFMLLGGHPPTAIHLTIVTVLYFLFRLIASIQTAATPQSPNGLMEHRRERPLLRAGLLAAAIAAGLLLAAPQILPYLEYYRLSSTPAASATLERWSSHLAPASLIHFLLPNVLGNPSSGFEDLPDLLGRPEPDNFNERTGYVAILPLVLAACAMTRRRCPWTRFYFFLAVGSLLVIFGVPPCRTLLRATPILHDVNQTRLLLVVDFSLAVLAALGWDEIARTARRRKALAVAAGFVALAAGALLWFWFLVAPKIHGLDSAHRAFLARQLAVLATGLILSFALAVSPPRWGRWLPTLVCLGWTACDLLWFAMGFNPSIPRDLYYPRTPAIDWLRKDDSLFRVFAGGLTLGPNTAEVFGLQDIRGSDYMTVRRYEEFITGRAGDFYFYRNVQTIPPSFPLLNAKYILAATAIPLPPRLFDLVYSNEVFIYRYKECRDRAFPVFDYEVEQNPATLLRRVTAGGFDPTRVLLLEDPPDPPQGRAPLPPAETTTATSVRVTSYRPDEVRIEAAMPRPGFLLLLDTYFPGWRASVNGQPARIQRADYNFRAVSLPAGRSAIVFAYRPESLRLGQFLCVATLLALAAAWFLPLKFNKHASRIAGHPAP